MMLKYHQALPVQLKQTDETPATSQPSVRTLAQTQNIHTSPLTIHAARRSTLNPAWITRSSSLMTTSKLSSRRHLRQQPPSPHSYSHRHQQQQKRQHHNRPRVIRASEYKNLRQVVPALRRQRDLGKVEVVTEAARYIDHLHKTLIERFVLFGIPEPLKDILGTDDANELNSQHIMRLVTNMASRQAPATPDAASTATTRPPPTSTTPTGANK